jgi:hypothetical protein
MELFQLALLWAIVLATIVWFVRDERRQNREKLEQAARFFAQAPQYRYAPAPAPSAPSAPAQRLVRNYLSAQD